MSLRRRRSARTLAIAAFLLAALVWASSIFFVLTWQGRQGPQDSFPLGASAGAGALFVTNSAVWSPGWSARVRVPWHNNLAWWFKLKRAPNAWGTTTTLFYVAVPLWIPVALTLPPLLITHAHVRRPLTRLRRGLCHRCAYDLASMPPDRPCPECGTPRLALPQRARPGRATRPA